MPEPLADAAAIVSALASINERLLVTPFTPFQYGDLQRIASLRGIPVLVTGSKPHTTVTINPGS